MAFFIINCTVPLKFDEPVESEPWYMNLYPTVDTEMNGVYYGPYDNIESLLEGILTWQNAYRVKWYYQNVTETTFTDLFSGHIL